MQSPISFHPNLVFLKIVGNLKKFDLVLLEQLICTERKHKQENHFSLFARRESLERTLLTGKDVLTFSHTHILTFCILSLYRTHGIHFCFLFLSQNPDPPKMNKLLERNRKNSIIPLLRIQFYRHHNKRPHQNDRYFSFLRDLKNSHFAFWSCFPRLNSRKFLFCYV